MDEDNRPGGPAARFFASLSFVVGRLADRRVRARWLTRLMFARAIHQDTTETRIDRYPDLFAAAAALLPGGAERRILSFGCSTGEEVASLRQYCPEATIVGAEINRAALATCRETVGGTGITFIRSTRRRIAAHGPYDAIFCMAVLQRRPNAVARAGLTSIAALYPFDRFDDELAFLTDQLRDGGLLIVDHAQYRVEDSRVAARLVAVPGAGDRPTTAPRFDRSGALIRPASPFSRIFRKSAAR